MDKPLTNYWRFTGERLAAIGAAEYRGASGFKRYAFRCSGGGVHLVIADVRDAFAAVFIAVAGSLQEGDAIVSSAAV